MVVFPGDFPGIAKENIHVVFDANADEVAGMLALTDRKDLIPQLEHIENGKKVCYTRQGMRIESPQNGRTGEVEKATSKAKTQKTN